MESPDYKELLESVVQEVLQADSWRMEGPFYSRKVYYMSFFVEYCYGEFYLDELEGTLRVCLRSSSSDENFSVPLADPKCIEKLREAYKKYATKSEEFERAIAEEAWHE